MLNPSTRLKLLPLAISQTYKPQNIPFDLSPIRKQYVAEFYTLLAKLFPQVSTNEKLFTDPTFTSRIRGKQTRQKQITTQKLILQFLSYIQTLKNGIPASQATRQYITQLPNLLVLTPNQLMIQNIPGLLEIEFRSGARSSSQKQKQLAQERQALRIEQQKIHQANKKRIQDEYNYLARIQAQNQRIGQIRDKTFQLASELRKQKRQQYFQKVRRQMLTLKQKLVVQPPIQLKSLNDLQKFFDFNSLETMNSLGRWVMFTLPQLVAITDFIGSWNTFQFFHHQLTNTYITEKHVLVFREFNLPQQDIAYVKQTLVETMFLRQPIQRTLYIPENPITSYFRQGQVTPFRETGTAYFQFSNPLELEYYAYQKQNKAIPLGSAVYRTIQLSWCAFQYLIYPIKFYFYIYWFFNHFGQPMTSLLKEQLKDFKKIIESVKLCQNVFFQIRFNTSMINKSNIYSKKLQLLLNLKQIFQNCQNIFRGKNMDLNAVNKQLSNQWYMQLVPNIYRQLGIHFKSWFDQHPNYVVSEEQTNYVKVQNVFISTWGLPLRSLFGDSFTQGFGQKFFEQFINTSSLPIFSTRKLGQRLDWQVYSKTDDLLKLARSYQFQEIPQTCLQQVNRYLTQKQLPNLQFVPRTTQLQQIIQFCRQNLFSLKIIGLQELSMNIGIFPFTICVSPGHIQISQDYRRQRKPNPDTIVSYRSKYTQMSRQLMSQPIRHNIPIEQWKLGKQLPLDKSIDLTNQIQLRSRVLVIDIQALSVKQQRQVPYLICAVGYLDINTPLFQRCWSNIQISYYQEEQEISRPLIQGRINLQSCIQSFVDWLSIISSKYTAAKPLVIWGYNLMGYEISYILLHLTKKFGNVDLQGPPNECKCFSVCQRRIVFADIMLIINTQSLKKNCDNYEVVVKKQQFGIGLYTKWQDVQRNYSQIKQYCYFDCISSLLLLHKVQTSYITIAKDLNIILPWNQIAKRYTASSIGFWFFINGFFRRSMVNKQQQLPQEPQKYINSQPYELYQKQRLGYYGGVVQVFKYRSPTKLFVVDINSMYPAMLKKPLPWHYLDSVIIDSKQKLETILKQKQSNIYFAEVESYNLPISFKGTFIPTKQSSSQKNTYFGSYSQKKTSNPCFIHGLGIKRILKLGGSVKVKVIHRYSGQNQHSLKNFADTFYQKRKNSTNPSIKSCLKLIMNSLIGRFSMSEKTAYKMTLFPKQDNFRIMTNNVFLDQGQTSLPAVGRMVRLTSMVTEYARIYLDQLAQQAGYQNVCYCDTDSLIVNQTGYINLGSPKTTAEQLGDFKCQGTKGKFTYYNQGYFFSRKNYLLQYQTQNGIEYLFKSKGIPKKFITTPFIQQIKSNFLDLLPQILKHTFGDIISLNIKSDMEVWRKSFKGDGGVTIKRMLKQVNVIVDRLMINAEETGYPHRICQIIDLE